MERFKLLTCFLGMVVFSASDFQAHAAGSAETPEITKEMKLEICSTVAHDYRDYDAEVDEGACLAGKFEVLSAEYNDTLGTFMRMEVQYASDMEECVFQMEKVITIRAGTTRTWWDTSNYNCQDRP